MDKREKAQSKKLRELVDRGEVKHIPGHGVEVSDKAVKEWKQLDIDDVLENTKELQSQFNKEIRSLNDVELEALKKFRELQGFKQDEKHNISNKMLKRQKQVAYAQDEFGINKYNKPLQSNYNYDWLKMATEELVDLGKYLECEMERKETIKALLEHALSMEDWTYVELALFELNKEGTGK